ncbi:MAG: heterodisulfide reductase subunit B [Deltaproteobacteria bacterium]|nr:heterodisulfide reductase subunit B [Deltaproteobacteria bacterium]
MNVSYYPGCCMHGTAKGYDQSIQAIAEAFGVALQEVADWVCCGASSAHATNYDLSIALPAQSLASAEKVGLDVLVPCAACYNRFRSAQLHLEHDADLKARVEATVGSPVLNSIAVRDPIDFFVNEVGLDAIGGKVTRKLKGLKPVAYYGCLLVRPKEVCQADDFENPVLMDRLLGALGAEPKAWSFKTDCCGGSLTIAKTDQVVRLTDRLMAMAREAGANCLVTACPECMANLDMRATAGLPVFYFSELMAIAMGLPGIDRWSKFHQTDLRPLLRQIGVFF